MLKSTCRLVELLRFVVKPDELRIIIVKFFDLVQNLFEGFFLSADFGRQLIV